MRNSCPGGHVQLLFQFFMRQVTRSSPSPDTRSRRMLKGHHSDKYGIMPAIRKGCKVFGIGDSHPAINLADAFDTGNDPVIKPHGFIASDQFGNTLLELPDV